jgi:hypothetical protein
VTVGADGVCSGYCTAGELNMSDGTWTTQITWTTAPDNGTDITVTYRERACTYTGNVATVSLAEQVAGAYLTENTFGAGCVYAEEIGAAVQDFTVSSSAGAYDDAGYPLTLYNDGVVYDEFEITFTSASNFTCSGLYSGDCGSGAVTADFAPENPDTGQPYFLLAKDGFGGTWQAGDTITFTTLPAALPLWLRETVPAGAAADDNLLVLGWYCE